MVPQPPKFPSCHFADGYRKTDFVLVYKKSVNEANTLKNSILKTYIANLEELGLETEMHEGEYLQDFICVMVHAPDRILEDFAERWDIDLMKDNKYYKIGEKVFSPCLSTFLTDPGTGAPIFNRASYTLSGIQPNTYTTTERILIVHGIMAKTEYGYEQDEVGFDSLIAKGIIKDAYPLHDTAAEWTRSGPLSDRQILARYWSNLRFFYTEQPLNLINSYFGNDVAFYFAWVGFYTRMLIPASVLSVISIISGIFLLAQHSEDIEDGVCHSNMSLCPVCQRYENCKMVTLRDSCLLMKLSYVLDNWATVLIAILISVWGIIFTVLWKRKQAMLRLRWNVSEKIEHTLEPQVRPEFEKQALTKISSITALPYRYVPPLVKFVRKGFSALILTIVILVYISLLYLVIIIRLNVVHNMQNDASEEKKPIFIVESVIVSALTVVLILVFVPLCTYLCKVLSAFEIPETNEQYEKFFVTKLFFMNFVVINAPLMYAAYIKGSLYQYPGDEMNWDFFGIIKSDVCKPSGCLIDVSVLLISFFVAKTIKRHVGVVINLKQHLHAVSRETKSVNLEFEPTQWEADYFLAKPTFYSYYLEYTEMMIQFSLIVFFIAALPISPILALLNNIFEIRTDAAKFVYHYRRPVPFRSRGIGGWNTVLVVMTMVGVVSNSILLAFTSTIVERYVYYFRHGFDMEGYFKSTLSVFGLEDTNYKTQFKEKICYYYGHRYPPSHPKKYQITIDYWSSLSYMYLFFIILENFSIILLLFLQSVIPEVPRKVRLKLKLEKRMAKRRKI